MIDKINAILALRPNANFGTKNDEIICWEDARSIPTDEEIKNKIIELEQAEKQAKQAKIEAKASALAKLSALGLTEEEVQAIIK
jgi:DNA-directed RNA polymerase subunit E'/Rpb7